MTTVSISTIMYNRVYEKQNTAIRNINKRLDEIDRIEKIE